MANIKRVRCTWSGAGVIGPSVSTYYFTATASGFPADLQTFFQAIKSALPDDVTITVPNAGDVIDETNGTLQNVWTDSGGSTTTGTASGAFQQGSGGRVKWLTGGIHNDRRVIGSTFLVPMASLAFTTFGIMDTASQAVIQTAASALVSAVTPDMVIWSKPTPPGGSDGESNAVIAASVPLYVTQLRSRRI